MKTPYTGQVEEAYLRSGPDFGDAHTIAAEYGALRQLYDANGKDRASTLGAIVEHGYPLPEDITPEMVALSGAAHACGVAIDLAETRGEPGKDSTYESYTIKNRFDRFVALHLPKTLRGEWKEPIRREENYQSPRVRYPEGIDETLIHGINKPNRFFPAQTMRYVEFARLEKLDEGAKKELRIDDRTDPSSYQIDWQTLVSTIEHAKDITELAGDIGSFIAERLLDNGLSLSQVAGILRLGFDTAGMEEEHGAVEQTDETYNALLVSLFLSPKTRPLLGLLRPTK